MKVKNLLWVMTVLALFFVNVAVQAQDPQQDQSQQAPENVPAQVPPEVSAQDPATILATGPQVINYQGLLTNASGTPASGTFSINFRIYSDLAGGVLLYQETQSVTIPSAANGVFNVLIGSVTPIPLTLFDTDPTTFLEVRVGGVALGPRRQFGSVPYVFGGTLSLPFSGSGSTFDPNCLFEVTNTGTGRAICGINSSASGSAYGIYGRSQSGTGFSSAVRGEHRATGGNGIGVYGSHAGSGWGVYGTAVGTGTGARGVYGFGTAGVGVYGTTNTGIGVIAQSSSTGDIFNGLRGAATVVDIDQYGTIALTPNPGGVRDALRIVNADNTNALEVVQNGTSVAMFIDQNSGGTDAVFVSAASGAGEGFQVSKAGGSGNCFEASHSGTGSSIRAVQSGTGPAISVAVTSTGGEGVLLSSNSTGRALDIVGTSTSTVPQFVNFERTTGLQNANDIVQIKAHATAPNGFQFIEAERGTDVKFRVDGDGCVRSDCGFFTGADLAEMIEVADGYMTAEPGDVMVISTRKDRAVEKCSEANSTLVFGICSAKPGFIGSEREWDAPNPGVGDVLTFSMEDFKRDYNELPVAVVGIVPCKVSAENGPIRPGDLLVTSNTPGYAMKAPADPKPGTILGKALSSLAGSRGTVKVYVTVH